MTNLGSTQIVFLSDGMIMPKDLVFMIATMSLDALRSLEPY